MLKAGLLVILWEDSGEGEGLRGGRVIRTCDEQERTGQARLYRFTGD